MSSEKDEKTTLQTARIAVYDDFLSAPRIVEIPPSDIAGYIEGIASRTYELAQAMGGTIPYTVIREVSENFIHAKFKEPTVSIFDGGRTIRFADQGPGIEDKIHAQLPGFTSATDEMKGYIRGVGSGFPIVKEYLRFSNGRLVIEDNLKAGTVITITVDEQGSTSSPVVYQETHTQDSARQATRAETVELDARARDVLSLARELSSIGPTDVKESLGITVSTAYRILNSLENEGFLKAASNRKRRITEAGLDALNGLEQH